MKCSMCRSGLLFLAILGGALVECGCANKSDSSRVQLTGKVTYKGNPVTGGKITFHPMPLGSGTPIDMFIGADGTLNISEVSPGEYKVLINTDSLKTKGGEASSGGQPGTKDQVMKGGVRPPKDLAGSASGGPTIDRSKLGKQPVYVAIPAKYKNVNTTPFSITLTKGKQEKNFDLTD